MVQVAADALLAVASQLTAAQSALAERLVGRGDVPEHHSPDAVFQVPAQSCRGLARWCIWDPAAL